MENRGSNFAWQVSDRLVDFGSAMTERDALVAGGLSFNNHYDGKGGASGSSVTPLQINYASMLVIVRPKSESLPHSD